MQNWRSLWPGLTYKQTSISTVGYPDQRDRTNKLFTSPWEMKVWPFVGGTWKPLLNRLSILNTFSKHLFGYRPLLLAWNMPGLEAGWKPQPPNAAQHSKSRDNLVVRRGNISTQFTEEVRIPTRQQHFNSLPQPSIQNWFTKTFFGVGCLVVFWFCLLVWRGWVRFGDCRIVLRVFNILFFFLGPLSGCN